MKKARFPRASYNQQLPFFACRGGQNPLPGPPCGATTTADPARMRRITERANHARRGEQCDNPILQFVLPLLRKGLRGPFFECRRRVRQKLNSTFDWRVVTLTSIANADATDGKSVRERPNFRYSSD